MRKQNASLKVILIFLFIIVFSLTSYSESETGKPVDEPAAKREERQADSKGVTPNKMPISTSGKISVDFKDADIKTVLSILSYKSGVNIVASPEVTGTVTMRLVDVPWEDALKTIVSTYGDGYEWFSDKVIMVSTLEKLAEQRKIRQEASEIEPLDTQTYVLNFVKADEVKAVIEKLVTPRAKISLEKRSNMMIVTDTKSNLLKIAEIVKSLDKMTPQVMIEAKLIETTLGNSEKLGIDWTMRIAATGSKRPTLFPFTDKVKGTGTKMFPKVSVPSDLARVESITYDEFGNELKTTEEKTWHSLVPGFPDVATNQFTFGTLDFSQMAVVLEALKSRADTKVISNPRITTLNNELAKILVGKVVPIPTYEYSKESGTQVITGYQEKEIGIKLEVTPNINELEYVTLNIKPSVDEIIGSTGPNGERPIYSQRSVVTNVMIKNNQTLVIGGLIAESNIKSKKGIPILGQIPILDLIFGNKQNTSERTELLIFITPHIIKEDWPQEEDFVKLEGETGKAAVTPPVVKRATAVKPKSAISASASKPSGLTPSTTQRTEEKKPFIRLRRK